MRVKWWGSRWPEADDHFSLGKHSANDDERGRDWYARIDQPAGFTGLGAHYSV